MIETSRLAQDVASTSEQQALAFRAARARAFAVVSLFIVALIVAITVFRPYIFFVPFALGQVPLVYVAQRVGLVGSLAAQLAVWGVASFLTGFVGSFGQLVALRFVLGLAESAFYATAMAYIAHWLPGKPLGEAVTLFATGGVGGSIIGGPSAGLILTYVSSAAGYAGWRWVFFAQAAPGLLLVPLLLCALPLSTSARRLDPNHHKCSPPAG